MALADTLRTRYPPDMSMFAEDNLQATLTRHTDKPTIHLAIPSIVQYNINRTILGHPEDVLRLVFEHAAEGDEVHTAFSSFSQPRPDLAPLSMRGISRQTTQYADAQSSLWTRVSGVQHSPNSPHPELVKLWIKRAGPTHPLSFHIAPREHPSYWEDEMTPAILRVFLQHAARWKDIAFDLDDALARIYLAHLSNSLKPQPQQVEHLELLASRVTDMEMAGSLFGTVECYAGTVTKFLWGSPKGFTPAATITLPHVKVLGLDVDTLDDACGCLEKLDLPNLEELQLCFTGSRGFHFWSDVRQPFAAALRQLHRTPAQLFVQDDEMNSEDVLTLIRVAKSSGIMTLGVTGPEAEMVGRRCLEKQFWEVHLPHIRGWSVHSHGRVDILL